MNPIKFVVPILVAAGSCGYASTILTVDNTVNTTHYQQTSDDPCIFGGSDCAPAAGFPTETSISVGGSTSIIDLGTVSGGASNGDPVLFNVLASQIRGLQGGTFGDVFKIGVDINESGSQPDINMVQFDVVDTTTSTLLATLPTNTVLTIFSNGTGFSDALLSSVDLTGIANGDNIQFRLQYNGASDGTDSFFLISTSAPPSIVPEPTSLSLSLMGSALVGLGILRKKRTSRG